VTFPAHGRLRIATLAILGAVLVAGCGALVETPPAPTPADFQGIAADLVQRGVRIDHIVSGDAGCNDQELARTAIGLDAEGLDQTTPTRVYLYIFRNRDAYDRLRQTVDACAQSYVADPEAFESFDVSPYVVASAGPWAPEFRDAVRAAVTEAAGTGD
jgi:hypothetical protein